MVPGYGPQPARGMIIGEAPGTEEVTQGFPFVGLSGRELSIALKAVGVDRREIYITNVVKEMPVNNEGEIRKPTMSEIEAWREILEGEIQHVAPEAILALGRTASDTLLSKYGTGIPFGSHVENVYTAYHPAYILRRKNLRNEWLEQIRPWAEAIEVEVEGVRW